MDAEHYLAAIRDRMDHGGYHTDTKALQGGAALIGHRSDFRMSWAVTKLHLFVSVKQVRAASRHDLEDFTVETLAYAKRTKGRFRGFQTGVAAIAILVAHEVESGASLFAESELIRQFSAFAWPVAVDLSTGQRSSHQGNPKIGRLYSGWMRQQISTVLPDLPTSASTP
jgi:hypothetical protein